MQRATAVLISVWLALATAGCGPKARLRNDPFAPSSGRSRPAAPASPSASDPFESANQRARERDSARDISTSPLTDPFSDRSEAADGREPRGQNVSRTARDRAIDPFESASTPRPATSSADPETVAKDVYQEIRHRLDRIGARNVRTETDEETGEHLFHCELPNPRDPVVFRVFEARHADEQKAMLAVTESAERWADQSAAR